MNAVALVSLCLYIFLCMFSVVTNVHSVLRYYFMFHSNVFKIKHLDWHLSVWLDAVFSRCVVSFAWPQQSDTIELMRLALNPRVRERERE